MITVLITNDDGIDAPGLLALERAFHEYPEVEVWTAAPAMEMSTCSHGMTINRPLFGRLVGERRFMLEGTPADCVYFALFGWLPCRPMVVLSGINRGPNLGTDVIYSGTVAGAREAVIRGLPGVAVSLVEGESFDAAARSAARIAVELARLNSQTPLLLNLNYPIGDFQGPRLACLGKRDYPEEVERRVTPGRGEHYYWLGGPPVTDRCLPGSDGGLIARGVASATLLSIDQGDEAATIRAAEQLPFLEPAEVVQ